MKTGFCWSRFSCKARNSAFYTEIEGAKSLFIPCFIVQQAVVDQFSLISVMYIICLLNFCNFFYLRFLRTDLIICFTCDSVCSVILSLPRATWIKNRLTFIIKHNRYIHNIYNWSYCMCMVCFLYLCKLSLLLGI